MLVLSQRIKNFNIDFLEYWHTRWIGHTNCKFTTGLAIVIRLPRICAQLSGGPPRCIVFKKKSAQLIRIPKMHIHICWFIIFQYLKKGNLSLKKEWNTWAVSSRSTLKRIPYLQFPSSWAWMTLLGKLMDCLQISLGRNFKTLSNFTWPNYRLVCFFPHASLLDNRTCEVP